MNKREQTAVVRRLADTAERHLATLTRYAEVNLATADLDELVESARNAVELARQSARNAVELATDGTPTCKRHADRAVVARNRAVDLAATARRAVEAEHVRRANATHAKRTMLERDYPALAAVVAAAPADTYFLDSAVALVRADDYRAMDNAMDTFGPSDCWTGITLPDPGAVAEFITEDTDARELAGVIRAYTERAEANPYVTLPRIELDEILAAAYVAGWRAPAEAFSDHTDVWVARLNDGYPAAVHGGDDDYDVAEAALLARARHGVFDDDHRPDDSTEFWEAWVVPGVPVWLPHVEAWREHGEQHSEVLVMRQMDRACAEWEDWGRDRYLDAYAEAYAEAILDNESPLTIGEEWDSGHDRATFEEEARERAERVVADVHVGPTDIGSISLVPDSDEIDACARDDAERAYLASARTAPPVDMAPLF